MKYPSIKDEIKRNKKYFDDILLDLHNEKDNIQKIQIIKNATNFATSHQIGIFNSPLIEESLIDISKFIKCNIDNDYNRNTFLHIFTKCYCTGGHTRICEKWIKYSPNDEIHSVILINQENDKIPQNLISDIKDKNGKLIILEGDDIKKAQELRKISSKFEKIILHTHMDDPIPILAFGNTDFKRPVIFFNHGDHLFWIGVSISDIVVNLRTFAEKINLKCRDVRNNFLLPIPIENVKLNKNLDDINKIKSDLGFNLQSKVIITMARGYKYKSFGNYNFIDNISTILDKNKNSCLLVIGPNDREKDWKKLTNKYQNRVKILGLIDNNKINQYIQIADIGLDSFPFSSFTSLLDIGKYNVPCFSLKTPINDIDAFTKSRIICKDQEELVNRIDNFLQNDILDQNFYQEIKQNHFKNSFTNNIHQLCQKTPKYHTIQSFSEDHQPPEFNDIKNFVFEMQRINKKNKKPLFKKIKAYIIKLVNKNIK